MPGFRWAVACLSERSAHRVVRLALGGRVPPPVEDHVTFLADWSALLQEVTSRPPALVVFDDRTPGFGIRAVRRLRQALPATGLVAWIPPGSGAQQRVTKLAALGVDSFYLPGREREDLGESIDSARAAALTRRVLAGLEGVLPAALKGFLTRLLAAAVRPVDVSVASRLNFSTPRTLRRHLKAAGFPPPRILITWCRLFHASALLENPRRSVLNVTLALDFTSPDALRHALRRHAGLTPTEVRDRGLDFLLDVFVERHADGWWGLHGS